MSKHKGLHTHRFRENPEEERFAKAWTSENDPGRLLDYLLLRTDGKPALVTERDEVVAATVVQWLGSPVGQGFLRDLEYQKTVSVPVTPKTRALTPESTDSLCCGKPLEWAQMHGLRVYKVVKGRMVYTAKCSACGKSFSVKGGVSE